MPVFILSRGDLNIEEGRFTPGIKMPKCQRYFNIFHPIDPIAYRIEPLIKQEMHDKAPVQLIQVSIFPWLALHYNLLKLIDAHTHIVISRLMLCGDSPLARFKRYGKV